MPLDSGSTAMQPVVIGMRRSDFRTEMAGWIRAGGYEPLVTHESRVAVEWVRSRPVAASFLDTDLERIDGSEVWRVVRRIEGRRVVLFAERRSNVLWFSALAEGVQSLLPLPAERDAVLNALRRIAAT